MATGEIFSHTRKGGSLRIAARRGEEGQGRSWGVVGPVIFFYAGVFCLR